MTVFKSLLWVSGIVCSMMWGGLAGMVTFLIVSYLIENKKTP